MKTLPLLRSLFIAGLFLAATSGLAYAQRISASYLLAIESTSSSTATLSGSADYSAEASLGADGGLSANFPNSEILRAGYIGQLVDIASFALNIADVPESGSQQASVDSANTDGTTSTYSPTFFTWTVTSGPAIATSNGVVFGNVVYQNTPASLRAQLGTLTLTRAFTVLDSLPDNYGIYGGDGIDDGWQVQYFGLNNVLAAPLSDPDHDGLNNRGEFLGGFVPTDPNSVLKMTVVSSTLTAVTLGVNQLTPTATYQLQTTTDFGMWQNLGPSFTVPSLQSNVVFPAGPPNGDMRYYRLQLAPRP